MTKRDFVKLYLDILDVERKATDDWAYSADASATVEDRALRNAYVNQQSALDRAFARQVLHMHVKERKI